MDIVGNHMTKAICMTENTRVAVALEAMDSYRVTLVVIVSNAGRAVGIFTLGDAALKVLRHDIDPKMAVLCDFMTAPVTLATREMSLREVCGIMSEYHLHHVPIVSAEGIPEGMVSLSILLGLLLEEAEISNVALSNYIGADSVGG